MKHHELKCHADAFRRVLAGVKRHEVRVNDRDYQPGDSVLLEEYEPPEEGGEYGEYSGRTSSWLIGHVTRPGEWGLPDNLCVFSLIPELRPDQAKALAEQSSEDSA